MDEEIRKIADHYGVEAQIGQTYEELGELIVALHKYERKPGVKEYDAIIEEIADVNIMLTQVRHLLNISDKDVEELTEYKVSRQLERIIAEAGCGE